MQEERIMGALTSCGRRLVAIAALCTATGILATGCAASTPAADALTTGDHIHELAVSPDGQSLLVATHEGLFAVEPSTGDVSGPGGEHGIDLMGLTVADEVLLASGHPGRTAIPQLEGPNLGLIRSEDDGESWSAVSLEGVADFHTLTHDPVSGAIIGSHAGQLLISEDEGTTWRQGAVADAYDLLATDGGLLMTSSAGLSRSIDSGRTFEPVAGAPSVVLLGGSGGDVVGIDLEGTLWRLESPDRWSAAGTMSERVAALALLPDGSVVVAAESGLQRSADLGQTWERLVR